MKIAECNKSTDRLRQIIEQVEDTRNNFRAPFWYREVAQWAIDEIERLESELRSVVELHQETAHELFNLKAEDGEIARLREVCHEALYIHHALDPVSGIGLTAGREAKYLEMLNKVCHPPGIDTEEPNG